MVEFEKRLFAHVASAIGMPGPRVVNRKAKLKARAHRKRVRAQKRRMA